MKNIIKLLLMTTIVTLFGMVVYQNKLKNPNTVRAAGDLTITYLGIPLGDPIFEVQNLLPGDPEEERSVDVVNGGEVAKYIAVKGIRTGPDDQGDPKLETVLRIVISENDIPLYGEGSPTGQKTLQQFFDDSSGPNLNFGGILLSTLENGSNTTYKFSVTFPQESGNEFQGKSVVFDIAFGHTAANYVVINEVYYDVDSDHGLDSFKDRNEPKTSKKKGIEGEWIELFNPTSEDINLKNWTLEDDSNHKIIIHANKIIKAGGFALISKDASLWARFWDEDEEAIKIVSTDYLGDGLGDFGDYLLLKDSSGNEIDFVRWENNNFDPTNTGWTVNSEVLTAEEGNGIERIVPGFDNDLSSDWISNNPPSPGF